MGLEDKWEQVSYTSSTLARRVAACDSISRVLVVAKINLPRSQSLTTVTVLATTAVLQMTFSMPSLFCLKLSLSPPIISKKHHAASADNIGVLKAPHTAPRPHHAAAPHSVGHGPQRVPIFFGILVGTHKKSRPRRRNRRRRTPRPNGKKKPSGENSEKLNRNFCKIN